MGRDYADTPSAISGTPTGEDDRCVRKEDDYF